MRFKRAGFLTKIVVLALLIYMATSLLDLRSQIQATQSQRDILAQQVADQRLENQELSDAIAHSDDPEMLEQVAIGSGPLDASFKAINDIVGLDVMLTNFGLNAVTDGEDAIGEATVKLNYNEHSVTGRGLSTDIIEASIRAYINGINKIMEVQ